jgi:two-component system OmpR family response regulator/two-component system alkaline phosphatase synthesis response regulator PhoP
MDEPDGRSRVLVVEDEDTIRDLIGFHLDLIGYDCTSVADGQEALGLAAGRAFDVIVLDLGLPSLDGMTLCRAIRREGVNREVPIMLLTARREEADKVLGLESGADDYLTKPFSIREFLARINALMRRPRSTWRASTPPGQRPTLTAHGITIDPMRRRVVCDGRSVSLTPQEFSLLYVLASNPGIVFTREEILRRVWDSNVFVTDRGVDALVKRLRRKVEADPSQPTRILTARGAGYKFGED